MRQEFDLTPGKRGRHRMRGATLTLAILKVAEGKLTDEEIAAELRIHVEAFDRAKQKPHFVRRVAEERKTLKLEKVIRKAWDARSRHQ